MKSIVKLKLNTDRITIYVIIILISNLFASGALKAQEQSTKNWAEKLGYPAGKKEIMLHL